MEIKLVQGDASGEILKAIPAENADLVVITTHGRGQGEVDQKSPSSAAWREK